MRRGLGGAGAVILAIGMAAACGDLSGAAPPGDSPDGQGVRVVATTTVLADLVRQAAGDGVDVVSLVPLGGEVHTYDPSPSDSVRISEADLVVMNGLGLDEWLDGLVEGAGAGDVPVIELAEDLDGVAYLGDDEHAEEGDGQAAEGDEHGHEGPNPHLWLDVSIAERYVERIVEGLATVDPDRAATYQQRGAAYGERLAALDGEIRERFAAIPEERRRVVSLHEAFPYFAAAYGITIVETIIEAPGQEPSAGEVAAIVDAIRDLGAVAILAESQFPDDLVATIAAETGARVVSDLHTDSVGPPPADTYEGAMRWNVERIAAALAGD